jgi:hypothetical protein
MYPNPYYRYHNVRGYGLSNLVGDFTLTVITGGIWLIWVIIREIRLAG